MAEYISFDKYPDSGTVETLLLKAGEADKGNVELFSIGRSWEGKRICAARMGRGDQKILVAGGFEAAEALGSLVIINYIYELSDCLKRERLINGYDISKILKNTTYYFVPCMNPDGFDILANGLNDAGIYYEKQKRIYKDDGVWRGNARGVMLDRNFPSGWTRESYGGDGTEFGGEFPESENESRALGGFTRSVKPNSAIVLSGAGNRIKFDSGGIVLPNSEQTAVIFSSISGLKLEPSGERKGRYTDWFIECFAKKAFNLNVGFDKNNVGLMNSRLREVFTIASLLTK